MPRAIWKGAISFGLVHVPVALYPASSESGIDFDWLDKRSMDPVGYKRVNKRTGEDITKEYIVKGVAVEGGAYVLLSDDEIKQAYPKTTQTIEIESFVRASEIPFTHLETPYYLEPLAKGEKVYALLREAMLESQLIGIARVVMHTKEHLAALIPSGPALMLNTLRWASEIRPWTDIKLPAEGNKALKVSELNMAKQLIADMTHQWQADDYADKFTESVQALVAQRAAAGKTETVSVMEAEVPGESSNVIDLTELLSRSLGRGRPGVEPDAKVSVKKIAPAKKAAGKTSRATAARKRA